MYTINAIYKTLIVGLHLRLRMVVSPQERQNKHLQVCMYLHTYMHMYICNIQLVQ